MMRSQPAYASVNVQSDQYSSQQTVSKDIDNMYPAAQAAIFTDNASYPVGLRTIHFSGFISSYNETASPYVVIHLLGPSGALLDTLTAKPGPGGQFSNEALFQATPDLAGQFVTVRAEYGSKIALNSFLVGSTWSIEPFGGYVASVANEPPDANQTTTSSPASDMSASGSTVVESIWVHNEFSKEMPYSAIMQVTNDQGTTVVLNSLQGILEPDSWTQLTATWPAGEKGMYHVRYFIVDSLSSPELIAPIHEHPEQIA
jgi:hypothetical protein